MCRRRREERSARAGGRDFGMVKNLKTSGRPGLSAVDSEISVVLEAGHEAIAHADAVFLETVSELHAANPPTA